MRRKSNALRSAVVAAVLLGGCQIIGGIESIEFARGAPCGAASDCESGELCLFGACSSECSSDAECAAAQECLSTEAGDGCVNAEDAVCENSSDCPRGTACADGRCRAQCSATAECHADQSCTDGACVPGAGGAGGQGGSGGSSGGSSGSGGNAGGISDAGPDASPGDGGVVPVCDPTERPTDTGGLFVSPDGLDSNVGSRQAPFLTIAQAVATATASGRRIVYLAPGAYQETLVLADLDSGVRIQGGWTLDGTRWVRDCTDAAREETQIVEPTSAPRDVATITFQGEIGTTVLQTVTIQTKLVPATPGAGEDGESMVALYADPTATGTLNLIDVAVQAFGAGDGGDGAPAAAPDPAVCTGQTVCADGADGLDGTAGTAAPRGHFTPAGYVPGRGGEAVKGSFGADGLPGGLGPTLNCVNCNYDAVNLICNTAVGAVDQTAGDGACGCGGPSGAIGGPGGGGGASVGLFVASANLSVGISGSVIDAGPGGDGGLGGAATPPVDGTDGVAGTAVTCNTSCTNTPAVCTPVPETAEGAPGGVGGPGGDSGNGGDGAGGPSHSIVTVGPSSVTPLASDLVFGTAGAAPGGTRAGAGQRVEVTETCGNGLLDTGEECDDANSLDDDACSDTCRVNCTGTDEFLDPTTGTCYVALPQIRRVDAARALCQHRGPGWDLMVPSTDTILSYLALRDRIPVSLYVGLTNDNDPTLPAWGSMTGAALTAAIPWDLALAQPGNEIPPELCAVVGTNGLLSDTGCDRGAAALCERRVANFQMPGCGDGNADRFEECDDGNADPDDGCSPECVWGCPPSGGLLSVEDGSCYQFVAALPSTWTDARDACFALGSGWDLPKVTDDNELGRIQVLTEAIDLWFGATSGDVSDAGVAPPPDGGTVDWRWVDGTAVNLTTWSNLAPAAGGTCAAFNGLGVLAAACETPAYSTVCEYRLP